MGPLSVVLSPCKRNLVAVRHHQRPLLTPLPSTPPPLPSTSTTTRTMILPLMPSPPPPLLLLCPPLLCYHPQAPVQRPSLPVSGLPRWPRLRPSCTLANQVGGQCWAGSRLMPLTASHTAARNSSLCSLSCDYHYSHVYVGGTTLCCLARMTPGASGGRTSQGRRIASP